MTRRLLLVARGFPFPPSAKGRIRTIQVLRGMKGGAFSVTLASPVSRDAERRFAAELSGIRDRFVRWPPGRHGRRRRYRRLPPFSGPLPVLVAADRSVEGRSTVVRELAAKPDLVVADTLHASVLLPERVEAVSALSAHNVEAEIRRRQAVAAKNSLERLV